MIWKGEISCETERMRPAAGPVPGLGGGGPGGGGRLNPAGTVQRAELAQMLMNLDTLAGQAA